MKKIRYYSSFDQDFSQTACQDFPLAEDYQWVRTDLGSRLLSGVIYGLAVVFGGIYCRWFLHMRVRGRRCLKGVKGACFLYGNHTQPVGDVFIPALCLLPKRIYTLVSPANYGIPVIGKLLPFLGALPVVPSVRGLKELNRAVEARLAKGHPIVIYPEAHVWEYYTKIRPFPPSSFKLPAKLNQPVFGMTVTYKKSKWFKKPVMEVFLDGPFYPAGETQKERAESLWSQVSSVMQERSRNSDVSYIEYRPETNETSVQ